jgi:predicted methyltransferase
MSRSLNPVTFDVSKPTISLVKLAHGLVSAHVKPGAIVLDATVGNGHDTLFLLDWVAPHGQVYGFDIQQAAIASAQHRLQGHPFFHCLSLVHASHATIQAHIPGSHHGKVGAVMFNLGYLPGGDKRVITQAGTTLAALAQASRLLAKGGIITILAYPGPEGGDVETGRVAQWCQCLDINHFKAVSHEDSLANPTAPKLFSVTKIRQ